MRARRIGVAVLSLAALLTLSSCSTAEQDSWKRLAEPKGITDRSDTLHSLWIGAWIAALIVGIIVWTLIIYACVKFYRRSDDEIPVQTRYNLPMEILYTIAPVIVVLVFFKFVIGTQTQETDEITNTDHTIKVVGQQWAWTFNYYQDDALDGSTTVYDVGTPAQVPTLYLPVGQSVRFQLSSPDVIHDFWVPAFSYKMDVVPGRDNEFTMTAEREGTFSGKCAELCGTYHSRMLFNVKVVSPEEYAQHLKELQAEGNVGVALGGSEATTQDGLNPNETEGSQ